MVKSYQKCSFLSSWSTI